MPRFVSGTNGEDDTEYDPVWAQNVEARLTKVEVVATQTQAWGAKLDKIQEDLSDVKATLAQLPTPIEFGALRAEVRGLPSKSFIVSLIVALVFGALAVAFVAFIAGAQLPSMMPRLDSDISVDSADDQSGTPK